MSALPPKADIEPSPSTKTHFKCGRSPFRQAPDQQIVFVGNVQLQSVNPRPTTRVRYPSQEPALLRLLRYRNNQTPLRLSVRNNKFVIDERENSDVAETPS
jgi:hypothetical protein